MSRGRYRNRIGLDIGSDSVKMVELFGPQERPALVSFGSKRISGLQQDAIARSIKSLAQELKVSSNEVRISLSGSSLIVRLISMPKMTDEELASAVRFEAEKFIPFDINDCIFDFQILNKGAKEKTSVDILLAAAKKERVRQKIGTVEEAGFTVKMVDVDIFAAVNSFLRNLKPTDPPKTLAVLNMGALSTGLGIVYQETPVFVREIAMGGNDMTSAIAKKTGLSQEASEALKASPKDKLDDLLACTKPVINSLLDELRLSFGYHENQSGKSVDEIYVSGGGAAMAGLDEAFQDAFGYRPIHWDPFGFLDRSAVSVDAKEAMKDAGSFSVAVGLALRQL